MFLRDVFLALARRWYLLLVGVGLAVAAAYFAWGSTGATYSARSVMMLLPPAMTTQSQTPGVPDGNPLLYLGSLGPARDALLVAMAGDEAVLPFQQQFPGSGFSVSPDAASSGPTIVVETRSMAAEVALESVRFAVAELGTTLDLMQDRLGVEDDARVRSMTVTSAVVARRDSQPQVRAALAAGGGTAVAAVLLIGLVDGLVRLRARRRAAAEESSDGTEETRPADAPDSELEGSTGPVSTPDTAATAASHGLRPPRRAPRQQRAQEGGGAGSATPDALDEAPPADAATNGTREPSEV